MRCLYTTVWNMNKKGARQGVMTWVTLVELFFSSMTSKWQSKWKGIYNLSSWWLIVCYAFVHRRRSGVWGGGGGGVIPLSNILYNKDLGGKCSESEHGDFTLISSVGFSQQVGDWHYPHSETLSKPSPRGHVTQKENPCQIMCEQGMVASCVVQRRGWG